MEMITRIIYYKKIEEFIARKNGKIDKHNKKWLSFNVT